jgi:hypothetical protein
MDHYAWKSKFSNGIYRKFPKSNFDNISEIIYEIPEIHKKSPFMVLYK